MEEMDGLKLRVTELEECVALVPEALDVLLETLMTLTEKVLGLQARVEDLEFVHNQSVRMSEHDLNPPPPFPVDRRPHAIDSDGIRCACDRS
jgi:hypothetical protein